jgi:hypothetical protein
MIEQGDTVVVIGTSPARAKGTGKTIKDDWVHIFKYSQGKMVFFQVQAQPVDATQALNLSAGVSNCKVSRGRSFS